MGKAWMMAAGLAVLFAGGAARAAGPAEDEITGLENKWTQAMTDRDRATLEAIMAPDWRSQNEKRVDDRASSIARTLKSKDHVVSASNRGMNVMVTGDVAVAQGIEDDRGTKASGKPLRESYSWMDVWQKRDGRWVAVRSQNSLMTKKPA